MPQFCSLASSKPLHGRALVSATLSSRSFALQTLEGLEKARLELAVEVVPLPFGVAEVHVHKALHGLLDDLAPLGLRHAVRLPKRDSRHVLSGRVLAVGNDDPIPNAPVVAHKGLVKLGLPFEIRLRQQRPIDGTITIPTSGFQLRTARYEKPSLLSSAVMGCSAGSVLWSPTPSQSLRRSRQSLKMGATQSAKEASQAQSGLSQTFVK